jgi:putative heme-binding domain-containing protein
MKWTATALLLLLAAATAGAAPLPLKKGDHICLIGNTLADRMQHFGWLETLIHTRFPKHELVFRNLGFSADELTVRLRSANFGTPDQWLAGEAPPPRRVPGVDANRFELTNTQADVIFAFFGYNESFAGLPGLDKFKKDLEAFIKHTLSQKYNGKTAPLLVLFSPIAHEDLKSPHLPDGKENNARLQLYTAAMADVAKAYNVPFVDLFTPTIALYAKADKPLTINGVHLNEHGDRLVAEAIDKALFGEPPAKRDEAALQKLRAAVNDKNFHWFHRYRTTDGYSTYGERAFLVFKPDGQSNYEVVQRELRILDVMTTNRDKRVWAVAQGRDLKVDDSNTPPFIPVKTNKPGPLDGEKHVFLSGEEAIQKMTAGKGLKISLFADEKMFPELVSPVQMAWDTKGRLWVAVWPTYPHWTPKRPMNDKLLVFEDSNGDGKADKMTVFADDLHCPTGFEFYNGGVLVAQAPDLVFLKDTDGDGKADLRQRVLHGLDSADTHHTSNSFTLDPGGAVYFQEGTFHHSQVETPYGPPARLANAGVFRYEPRTQKFEVYVTYPFANPHGHIFDRWGQDIVVDGTGAQPYHGALFSGRMDYPQKHARPPQVYQQRTRPCPGIEYLSSRHFPAEFQGNLLVANVIAPTVGILRYKIDDKGASFAGSELETVVSSTDPNFRPSDLKIGPDGAIWFIDWHNPIIGHMQHNLRDPNRDHEHGRIYRITHEGRALLKPVPIADQPIDKLLDVLKEPEDRVRYRARIELGSRKTEDVLAAVRKWTATLDAKHPDYEHHLLEALWLHQSHNVVNLDLLNRMLTSPNFRARAAATRVLCYQRDRVPDALELLKKQAGDKHPRVRLEAIRAASFVTVPEATEIPLIAAEQPSDVYLDFVRNETHKVLDPVLKTALAQGRQVNFTTAAGARYLLRNLSVEQLLKMERTHTVCLELLYRTGVRDEQRRDALRDLAKLDRKPETRVLLDVIAAIDERKEQRDEGVVLDLVRLLTTGRSPKELVGVRGDIEKLAIFAHLPIIRQIGFVALMNLDGSVDKAWALAVKSASALRDLVSAMPLVADASLRAGLYPKVEPLLQGLPKELKVAGSASDRKAVSGRYVRIELPGRQKTLTLAEVEVFSDGKNVARQGKASQKNTAHGGEASRGIDGNKSGAYSDGGQMHSQEGTADPWWEVDLGSEFPIESVVIWNRTDGNFGKRLGGFSLKVLDKDRKVVFEKAKQEAPEIKAVYAISSESPERAVRHAAMNALTSVRGQETKTFQSLARYLRDDADRSAAIHALQRIPRSFWPKEEAKPLLDVLLAYIRKVPAAERTSPAALDALEFADSLASLLPADQARKLRAELGELGVRVIRVGTLPERMAYDKELIVVKAGKPVEFLFENFDLMPHNLVITQPGALEEIGKAAEATATDPDAAARHFVPRSPQVLLGSVLLQPRETQKLSWTAPTQPGVYPYVCTYPGHWMRMHGALYVVADLDQFQENPEAYLAKNPLPIKDALLKDRRPRTEWKLEDLASAVEELKGGRSYGNGKQMFQVATCVACHRMDGVGNEFAPDLTKLDEKLKPIDLLKELLEPSAKINEKYQTYIFVTKAGQTITGVILEEKPDQLKIIENPLAKSEPRILKTSDIEAREKSPVSMMPKGLLDKLSRDEILDLIAYIAARGDRNHPLFRGDGHGGHGH